MKTTPLSLAPFLEGFFVERLMTQKRVSNETISAYRDTFSLLLRFAQKALGKAPSMLDLHDLDALFICDFLNNLEQERQNCSRTRNHRLAAIRSFFRYLSFRVPHMSGHIQRVLSIPDKRWHKSLIDFLTVEEVDTILESVNKGSWSGRRDLALITLAVHTGFRVSELINLRCEDIFLGSGAYVVCHGKGRKERCVPISKNIVFILKQWLRERNGNPHEPLFPNKRGGKLSRDGVQYILNKHVAVARKICPSLFKKHVTPHVLRHTTAVHLLQAGVDLSVIALWLGHENTDSTQIYADSDLEYKRKILKKTIAIKTRPVTFHPDDKLMTFLQNL